MNKGDVLLMKNGDVGIVRNTYPSKKYNTCIVELKGKPQELIEKVENAPRRSRGRRRQKSINGNQTVRIKVSKPSNDHNLTNGHKNRPKPNVDFKKLSSEQLFDKLFLLHEVISEDHVHKNKLNRLYSPS